MGKFFDNQIFLKATLLFAARWLFVLTIFFLPVQAIGASPAEGQKTSLRQQMDDLQRQIDGFRSNIAELQQQGKTLKREIALFDSKIKAAELEINRTALSIEEIEKGIADKDAAMAQAELELAQGRRLLKQYVQAVYEADQEGTLEMILGNEKLSDIFDRASSLQQIQKGLQGSMAAVGRMKAALEEDRAALESRWEEFNQLKVLQEIQRRALAGQQQEKKDILVRSRGQESDYQSLIKKAKADVDSIKQTLYLLEGAGLAMSLEKAYQYAKKASVLTGIRPAFLLAVLKNESSWGEKVGTGTWRKDMHVRDQKAFLQICDELDLNPDAAAVSRKPAYGWGGAMGPAQFLPSVWSQYKETIARLTGHNPPNPWDIGDAFVAASVKLTQAGAGAQNYKAEWKAAQIYFAGSRWDNQIYYFYGDQVMEAAAVIQEQLDIIAG